MDGQVEERNTPPSAEEVAALCEQVAYDRKGEKIISLNMTGMNASCDHAIIVTGLSEPHIGAIAERIKREIRTRLGVRPCVVDGTPASHWMIVDYGSVMVHVLTADARDKYELESLWGDAPRTDVIARLDAEARRRFAALKEQDKTTKK